MKSLTVYHCMLSLIIVLIFSDTQVTAQEGPGIVIAHPGQDVKLLCTVTRTLNNEAVAWVVNNRLYRINALRSGILTGHSATLDSNNLIVEDIMMNDVRNGSEYQCVIVLQNDTSAIQRQSDRTVLYVAGVPLVIRDLTLDSNIIVNGNNVTLTLSWGEPFNNLDPIVNYTVSCSGDITCPPNFTTTDNTTRSYTITNLTTMTNYIFSVVATNSIGSGDTYAVVISIPSGSSTPINTTIDPTTTTTTNTTNTTASTTAATAATTTTTTTSVAQPSSSTMVDMVDDETDNNGAVIAIIVVIIVLTLCGCVIMDIIFCYCSKRKERHDQDNKEDDHSKLVHYSIIILAICTLGTSILLWWLYKELDKYCGGKDKYDVEGQSPIPLSSPKTKLSKKNGHKDKNVSKDSYQYDDVKGGDTSIQGSPTEISYAATTKALGENTQSGPALQYDYARTGAITIVGMPNVNNTQQPAPNEPILEGYAVTDIIPAKDKETDKKGKVDTKNQQPMQYAVVDKNKKKKKKDDKQQKNELNYMDPDNLEFKEEPHKRSHKSEETVQYGNVAEAPTYTNI